MILYFFCSAKIVCSIEIAYNMWEDETTSGRSLNVGDNTNIGE